MINWNPICRNRKSVRSQTGNQLSIADYEPQPETRYKVFCNDCNFEYFTNQLTKAKMQSINHEDKNNSHYSEIEFLKGVAVF